MEDLLMLVKMIYVLPNNCKIIKILTSVKQLVLMIKFLIFITDNALKIVHFLVNALKFCSVLKLKFHFILIKLQKLVNMYAPMVSMLIQNKMFSLNKFAH